MVMSSIERITHGKTTETLGANHPANHPTNAFERIEK